ncbi:MAG: NAD(P)/FAD-dependent oxidoreductase [Frankiaceae bacterium]|nr:NAD(P)/FAD-dependent oxidoreductase [Frankiaceae bacterium]
MTVDAVVIGAGPNGLTAATLLARAGWSVELLERRPVAGGAVGSVTTDRGYVHDWGSAFYGVLHTLPVLAQLGLDRRVSWAHSEVPVAAVWDRSVPAAVMRRTPEATAAGLGPDAAAWLDTVAWWERLGVPLFDAMMGPIGAPLPMARVAARTTPRELLATVRTLLEPVEDWVRQRYAGDAARMLFASNGTHADVGVDSAGSTPASMLLAMAAQVHGMPVPVGGARALAAGFVEAAEEAGVVVRTGVDVTGVVIRGGRAVGVTCADGSEVQARRAVVADVAPTILARDLVGEDNLPAAWLEQLRRHRYTSGYFRVDVDLSAPAAWSDERLRDAMVVHVIGDMDEIAVSQAQVRRGLVPDLPQIILGQQDRADPTRVPPGAAALWLECHCPATPKNAKRGWEKRFADRLLSRIEEHAPGVRDNIVDMTVTTPLDLQAIDPNLVGGDVGGGSATIDQMLVFRPVAGWSSYALPVGGLYMCGAASHPGGGVHGMCGRNAAHTVLRDARVGLPWLRGRLAR